MKPLATALILLFSWTLQAASQRDLWWETVKSDTEKGLPRSAITNLDRIIPSALKDKAWGEAAKGIAQRIVLRGSIEGNKPEEQIRFMDAEIAQAPGEILPLLETLRAHWYWAYFQQNRWRFMRRTATAEAPGQDFTTWDLARLFAEIDRHFAQALSRGTILRTTPVSVFDDLLIQGSLPDRYRPTLYDFIAHEALSFYTSGEQAAARRPSSMRTSRDWFGAMRWRSAKRRTAASRQR